VSKECCPKIVFLDLDGTVWSSLDISAQKPPFRKVSENKIVDFEGLPIELNFGVKEFLIWARRNRLKVYSLSWNIPEIAIEALKAFEIFEMFDGHFIEYHPYKGMLMKKALNNLGLDVKPCQIVYVDDRDMHLENVRKEVGNVVFIQIGVDVKHFLELKSVLKNLLRDKCV